MRRPTPSQGFCALRRSVGCWWCATAARAARTAFARSSQLSRKPRATTARRPPSHDVREGTSGGGTGAEATSWQGADRGSARLRGLARFAFRERAAIAHRQNFLRGRGVLGLLDHLLGQCPLLVVRVRSSCRRSSHGPRECASAGIRRSRWRMAAHWRATGMCSRHPAQIP